MWKSRRLTENKAYIVEKIEKIRYNSLWNMIFAASKRIFGALDFDLTIKAFKISRTNQAFSRKYRTYNYNLHNIITNLLFSNFIFVFSRKSPINWYKNCTIVVLLYGEYIIVVHTFNWEESHFAGRLARWLSSWVEGRIRQNQPYLNINMVNTRRNMDDQRFERER